MYDFSRFSVEEWRFDTTVPRNDLGTVYEVRRKDGSGPFLGQVLPAVADEDLPPLQRTIAQATKLERVDHPRLLCLHGCGIVHWHADRTRRPWVVSDWFAADALLVKNMGHRVAVPRDVVPELVALLDAVRLLAANGSLHGNISPETIVFADDGSAQLLHPIHARLIADCNALHTSGTSNWDFTYAPPESFDPHARPTPAGDIFALSAVAYHLLTGSKPFASSSVFGLDDDLLAAVRPIDPTPYNLAIDANLALVLAHGLGVTPARRYRRPEEMIADLRQVARGRPPPHASHALAGTPLWDGDGTAVAATPPLPPPPTTVPPPRSRTSGRVAATASARRSCDRRSSSDRKAASARKSTSQPRVASGPASGPKPPEQRPMPVTLIVLVVLLILSAIAAVVDLTRRQSAAPNESRDTWRPGAGTSPDPRR